MEKIVVNTIMQNKSDTLDFQRKQFQKTIENYRNLKRTIKDYPWDTRSLASFNDIYFACLELYHSNTIFRGAPCTAKKRKDTPNVDIILRNLAKKFHDYFNNSDITYNNQDAFDSFHEIQCESFMKELNEERAKVPYDPISYGQAQKMINVLFKYFCCYGDYFNYADKFKYCHIIIDAGILKELKDIYGINSIVYRNKKGADAKFEGKSWTNLNKNGYLKIVKEYRDKEKEKGILQGRTFFELEFDWWAKNNKK